MPLVPPLGYGPGVIATLIEWTAWVIGLKLEAKGVKGVRAPAPHFPQLSKLVVLCLSPLVQPIGA